MYSLKTQDQGLITLSQQDYLPIGVDSFLVIDDDNYKPSGGFEQEK